MRSYASNASNPEIAPEIRRTGRVSRASIHDGAKARSLHFTVLTAVIATAAAIGTFLVGARAGAALDGHASSVSIAGMKMPRFPAVKTTAALPR